MRDSPGLFRYVLVLRKIADYDLLQTRKTKSVLYTMPELVKERFGGPVGTAQRNP